MTMTRMTGALRLLTVDLTLAGLYLDRRTSRRPQHELQLIISEAALSLTIVSFRAA